MRSGGNRYENDGAVPFRGKNAEKIGAGKVRWGRRSPETVGKGLQ